jgi:hypothetical protein
MNKLANPIILHIINFIDHYNGTYLWNYFPSPFIKIARTSKRFYNVIKDSGAYQFEHAKTKMREIKNAELIKTVSNDLDIVVPNGIISEAYFYMAYPSMLDYISCDDFELYINKNADHFVDACKKFNWEYVQGKKDESGHIDGAVDTDGRECDILTHKTITIPIRTIIHSDQKNVKDDYMTVIKLPLYCYDYLHMKSDDESFWIRISNTQKCSDICHFIISNGHIDKCKNIVLKHLQFMRNNPDDRNCPRIESVDNSFYKN